MHAFAHSRLPKTGHAFSSDEVQTSMRGVGKKWPNDYSGAQMTPQRFSALIMATCTMLVVSCGTSTQRLDLIVRGGQVLDGSGQPPQRLDVGITGDRIVRIGDLSSE